MPLPKELWDRPEAENLERFLDRLLESRREELEFVVLFGSMAKGNWSLGSDYDILVGLRGEDGKRLVDRMGEFASEAQGNIEVFPYARSEWTRMFRQFSLLFLEALEHGMVLYDRGGFAKMSRAFRRWRERGLVAPSGSGWKISAQPFSSRLLKNRSP